MRFDIVSTRFLLIHNAARKKRDVLLPPFLPILPFLPFPPFPPPP
jgi:hypothetical protein